MNQDEKFLQLFQLAKAINTHKCICVSIEYCGTFELVEVILSSTVNEKYKLIQLTRAYLDKRYESIDEPTLDQLLYLLEQVLECIEVGRTPTQKDIEFEWNQTDESLCAFAGLAAHAEDDQLKQVPEGEWFFNEERLLVTDSHTQIKTLNSDKAVLNFACRYGIDARRVRFMECRS